MKPRYNSKNLIKITHSKAKMYEYKVPENEHLSLEGNNPSELFSLMIGMLGDFTHDIINDANINLLEKIDDLKIVADFFDTYIKINSLSFKIGYIESPTTFIASKPLLLL